MPLISLVALILRHSRSFQIYIHYGSLVKVIQLNPRPRVFTSEDDDRGRVEVKYK